MGPNGSGKSTLLKVIAGKTKADQGEITRKKHTRINYLSQADNFVEEKTVLENLLPKQENDDEQIYQAQAILNKAEFSDQNTKVKQLSGGWRKRLSICRSLMGQPDILIMDEPTNHLDIEGIIWLEKLILNKNSPDLPKSFLMVSHDRQFLANSCNRMMELSASYPGCMLQVNGNYDKFLQEKEAFIQSQQELETRLSNKMRRENEWLSRGPKARATKAKYRIDAASKLADELSVVKKRNRAKQEMKVDFTASGRKTKKLLQLVEVSKSYQEKTLFSNLNLEITNTTRLGLLGPNGSGKSTLMQIMAQAGTGAETIQLEGEIITADKVNIVYFDQKRARLDHKQTLKEALSPDGDSVIYREQSIHVVTWAKKFLFRPEQLDTPVERLSGGEQARIVLANLMLQPADILLLDEPANDLDIPALEVLEESLLGFPGGIVLVSHDRYMMENVCDKMLGFDGKGNISFFADYQQWLSWLQNGKQSKKKEEKTAKTKKKDKPGKLSYMQQREFDGLEEKIIQTEEQLEEIKNKLANPEVNTNHAKSAEYYQMMQETEEIIEKLYSRWQELEDIKTGNK